jgi:hypothetical protein
MKRKLFLAGIAAVVVSLLLSNAGATGESATGVRTLRWDLIDLDFAGTAGGKTVSTDPTTGETLTLTGSGTFDVELEADGGGRFVHRSETGKVLGRGVYRVTKLGSWDPSAGSLVGSGLIDAIGDLSEARSGIARLRTVFYVRGEVAAHALVTVFCDLPGGPTFGEGVTVRGETVDGTSFNFSERHPDEGPTIFHVID